MMRTVTDCSTTRSCPSIMAFASAILVASPLDSSKISLAANFASGAVKT